MASQSPRHDDGRHFMRFLGGDAIAGPPICRCATAFSASSLTCAMPARGDGYEAAIIILSIVDSTGFTMTPPPRDDQGCHITWYFHDARPSRPPTPASFVRRDGISGGFTAEIFVIRQEALLPPAHNNAYEKRTAILPRLIPPLLDRNTSAAARSTIVAWHR